MLDAFVIAKLTVSKKTNSIDMTTITTILCPPPDFVWDYPGEPVPERYKKA